MEALVTKLSDATKALHELASMIQESNSTSNWRKHDTEASIKHEDAQYAQVTKELEHTKHELIKLKRDIARVSKEKRDANRALKASNSKRLTLLASIELMNKEIQELKVKRVKEEKLEDAKHELEIIKGEGFNFMTSMDSIRDELNRVRVETEELLKTEEVHDSIIQILNSKILSEKSKLESISSMVSKTDMVASNLVFTLDQLRSEIERLYKEEGSLTEEIENTRREIRETENEIGVKEEKLEAAIEELEVIKLLEFEALWSLRNVINATMEARDTAFVNESMITLTDFEYGYLIGNAGRAVEVADKKIDAAQAWVEALNANEREVLMKIEMLEREISKLSVEPGPSGSGSDVERAGLGERVVASGRRSMYRVGSKAGVKRVKLQKFRSSGARYLGKMGSLRKEKVTQKLV
ncbi:protein PLASTID MOVEMENT IMPAIRED 15-like [Bidens hawaiensis]|uniref:protein PLASTID MOVEMENT IMPAIRED 15-like n=1 Tax=Bidens hawaiensis TaxID=980011 RepID=UPI00404955B9